LESVILYQKQFSIANKANDDLERDSVDSKQSSKHDDQVTKLCSNSTPTFKGYDNGVYDIIECWMEISFPQMNSQNDKHSRLLDLNKKYKHSISLVLYFMVY
jgi:hypothetical protein